MKRLLIFGCSGQVGFEIAKKFRLFPNTYQVICDNQDLENVESTDFLQHENIDFIINAVAFTAVDAAEDQKQEAKHLNENVPRLLAIFAAEKGITLIHFSTDYVFDGTKTTPYIETDQTAPINEYGRTKYMGEQSILATKGCKALVFRTSWVYSSRRRNFLLAILNKAINDAGPINVVEDQYGAPTSAFAIADAIFEIIDILIQKPVPNPHSYGLYHMTCSGKVSWFDFAKSFVRQQLPAALERLQPIPSTAFKTKAARPKYSVLSNEKLKRRFGVSLPSWEESLRQVLSELNVSSEK